MPRLDAAPSRAARSAGDPPMNQRAGSWTPTFALIAGVTLARLAYLARLCPYLLSEDEAHYWEWSRRLGWSYYSKGPGIALAIRAATESLGASEFSIRVPAALASAIAAFAVAALAADVSGSRRIGLYAGACFLLSPMFQLPAIISTIDSPFIACWALACWMAWRALHRQGRWEWLALGAAIGIGFLFKYTILLLLPGLAAYALVQRRQLALAPTWRVWAAPGLALAAAGLAPIIIWNAPRAWPTLRHLVGHLGLATGDMPASALSMNPLGPPEFAALQVLMVGPALLLALIATLRLLRRRCPAEQRAGPSFLLWCAAPILAFYLAISIVARPEGNWAMGAYVSLLALAGWLAADGITAYRAKVAAWLAEPTGPDGRRPRRGRIRRKPETPAQVLWHAAIVYGLIAGLGMLRLDLLARAGQSAGFSAPAALGRLIGADEMARHAAELAADLQQETGRQPFIIARHYGRAGVLAFYLRDTPLHVYCASSRLEGRPTQYDYWPDTDLDDPSLRGRPAVLVGESLPLWSAAFTLVREAGTLRGDTKSARPAFLGLDYKGLPSPPRP